MLFHSTLQSWASSISQSFVTAASICVVADLFVQILFSYRFYLCYTRKGGIGVWLETTCGHALLGASFFSGVCEPHIYSTLNIIKSASYTPFAYVLNYYPTHMCKG